MIKFLKQALEGLDYLHSNNLSHRDIKPENFLLDHKKDIVLCDFGFIKSMKKTDPVETKTDYIATRWYRSPEILRNSNYDHGSDIWALGLVVVELVTRQPLLPGNNCEHMLQLI